MKWVAELLAVGLALIAPSILPALALARRLVTGLLLAPLLTAGCASVALLFAIWVGTPVWPWLLLVLAVTNALGGRYLWTRGFGDGASHRETRYDLVVGVAAALPLLALTRPNLGWDSHAIWLFHARWAFAGGDFYRQSLGNAAFATGHSDYPPLIPATVGLLWKASGGVSLRAGQMAITVMNVSAVGLLGLALRRIASVRLPAAGVIIGAGIALTTYAIAGKYAINGYADLLYASAGAGSVAYLLILPRATDHFSLGILLAFVTCITKNEGFLLSLIVVALALVRYKSTMRRALPASLGVIVAGVGWLVTARVLGAKSDQYQSRRVQDVLTGRIAVASRLSHIIGALAPHLVVPLVLAVVCSLLGRSAYRFERRALGLGSPVYVWTAVAIFTILLVGLYLITVYPLARELRTTVDRTTIVIQQLLLLQAACSLVVWNVVRQAAVESERRSSPE